MKAVLLTLLVLSLSVMTVSAAEQTWTGKISDSMCGATHKKMSTEHGAKGAKAVSDRDCTLACVKGGGKFVFARGAKVYPIANQDFAGLTEHAGHTVKLKGEMKGDTITVSSIEMPASKAKAKKPATD